MGAGFLMGKTPTEGDKTPDHTMAAINVAANMGDSPAEGQELKECSGFMHQCSQQSRAGNLMTASTLRQHGV